MSGIDVRILDAGAGSDLYETHLRSEQWWHCRLLMYAWTRWSCEWCGFQSDGLNVHHLHYRTIGKERPTDLVVLCERCHKHAHQYNHDLSALAKNHPESWANLRDILGYEPREEHARAKLSTLVWSGL